MALSTKNILLMAIFPNLLILIILIGCVAITWSSLGFSTAFLKIWHPIIYSDSAAALWKDLHERFSQSNAPHIFHIEQAIHELTHNALPVTAYFTKLKGLWDELNAISPIPLCSCDALKETPTYQQRQHTMKFLMGLNESYSVIWGQILFIEPLPIVNKALSLVLQEERQRKISPLLPAPDVAALASRAFPHTTKTSGGASWGDMGTDVPPL